MKKIIIHSIPVVISVMWLTTKTTILNPLYLKGPEFLKFYLILLLGFYISILLLKSLKETISKTTFYFVFLIFILGIIKLLRGIILGKPIGFLVMILIIECIVGVVLVQYHGKDKIK